ncbi:MULTISPECIES: hypothetical protein [unclassified Aeromicrobium]|uniref:hypothetical protein n=1 Tax=unclassified Aeromicrobium TaxID=2633570 RepID=UPI00396B01AF
MTIAQRMRILATAALLFVALAACSDDNGDPATSDSTSTTSPSSATTPPTESQQAASVAEAKLREYFAVRNRLRQDPSQSFGALKRIAVSTELTAQQRLFEKARRDRVHQTGETRIAELKVRNINLDNSDPQAGKVPVVQIDVCYDVSDVDLVNEDGQSVVSADRPETGWIRYTVANYEWESDPDGAWRVASGQDIERTPCAAL